MAKDIGIIHETFRLYESDKHQVEIKVYCPHHLSIKSRTTQQDFHRLEHIKSNKHWSYAEKSLVANSLRRVYATEFSDILLYFQRQSSFRKLVFY